MQLFNRSGQDERFANPEEEITFLREKIAEREKEIAIKREKGENVPSENTPSREAISAYKELPIDQVIEDDKQLSTREVGAIVLELAPEAHDETIAELLGLMQAKGIKNTLEVIKRMNDPHIEDDFERFLVQYLKSGFTLEGLKDKDPIIRALRMTVYEILLPEVKEEDKKRTLKELISTMEQFYAGMLSVHDGTDSSADYFTIEVAVANHSDEFVFYASVPDRRKSLFEKHILSVFHGAKVKEKKDDYNIFSEGGATVGSFAKLSKNPALPLKSYEEFSMDPLNMLLSSFSKIDKHGEGAAIQIILKPAKDKYIKEFTKIIEKAHKGEKISELMSQESPLFIKQVDNFFKFVAGVNKGKTEEEKALEKANKDNPKPVDKQTDEVLEEIKKKISSPIFDTNIRVLASAKTEAEADEILSSIESSFNQFENTKGNRIEWMKIPARKSDKLVFEFVFRQWGEDERLPLNINELTTIIHFPSAYVSVPELKMSRSADAPAPLELAREGITLGINVSRGEETKVFYTPEDRLRHFYTIGQTGTGKTTLLKNMITQDILNGEGVCMIDPHGSDIEDILGIIPPERYEDVIYFDPSYTPRPMGLNMIEFDARYPEQKTFAVNEMLSIFNKLFDMKVAGGPMFEQYFRNSVMLVMEDPSSGNTLLDVSRTLANKAFRDAKLANCKNPIVYQFWKEVAEKAGGESSLANIVPYITSKFDVFLSNEIMRPIIAQDKSAFNFREIMDNKKILLVNLSKGRLGDLNANLIGLILVGKILMAALSRVDSIGKDLPPFYLYIDEFQNITTDSISAILSEARKYKLSLNIAHQFIAQLDEKIKDSVFGNVGSIASFRVGSEDAEFLEKQFSPVFTAKDLMNIDNRNAYMKMLAYGKPIKPFSMQTLAPMQGNRERGAQIKELSYLKYGRERAKVEEEIMAKYKK